MRKNVSWKTRTPEYAAQLADLLGQWLAFVHERGEATPREVCEHLGLQVDGQTYRDLKHYRGEAGVSNAFTMSIAWNGRRNTWYRTTNHLEYQQAYADDLRLRWRDLITMRNRLHTPNAGTPAVFSDMYERQVKQYEVWLLDVKIEAGLHGIDIGADLADAQAA